MSEFLSYSFQEETTESYKGESKEFISFERFLLRSLFSRHDLTLQRYSSFYFVFYVRFLGSISTVSLFYFEEFAFIIIILLFKSLFTSALADCFPLKS